ncbi:MAG: UDP-2,3-diacylglucosamine diphosphatase LpxI [Halanaerobacter sp.]
MTEKLGLIAGDGNLPVYFAQGAKQAGLDIKAVAVTPNAKEDRLADIVPTKSIDVGLLDEIITYLKEEGLSEIVLLGKVTKELLFQGIELDQRFKSLLAKLPEKNDDAIMLAIVNELQEEGIEVSDQTKFMDQFLVDEGLLTNLELSREVEKDMDYGFKMAKEIGKLDIGQTVVVKDQAVMAVEAIEGTDEAILRGGKLGQGEVVAAKVAKPQQDLRFDIPTIGLETIENLIEVDAQGLVIEADKTFIVKQDQVVAKAEEAGVVIKAVKSSNE